MLKIKDDGQQAHELLNGLNIMVESVRFENEQFKKKLSDMRHSINTDMDQLKKDIKQAAKGIKPQANNARQTEEEKKEPVVPHAEFLKMQDLINEH
jgi:RNA polymerase-binding transcription factor DksA